MKSNCPRFAAFFTCLSLVFASASLRAAAPFISEVMPDNARTLADEDGDFPDWIEIHNPGPGAVNLQGWFLTDNPLVLSNWAFPSVSLPAGSYLVVFASGKNRTSDPARLHTSFQLEASGEYLALVQADGATVASAFDPAFPSVKEDVAFGVSQAQVVTALLAASAPGVLVPANAGELPPDWNLASYVPGAAWSNGVAPPAVGFDTNQSSGLPSNVAPSGTAAQSTQNGSFAPNLALNGNFGDFTHTLGTDTTPFWQVTLTNVMFIHSVVLFNRTSCCGSRLRDITIEILATNGTETVTNFRSALLNPENAGFTFPGGPAYLSNNIVALTGLPALGHIVRVRRTADPDLSGTGGQGNADEPAVISLGEVVVMAGGAAGLRPYFTADIEAAMWNRNASAFVRVPFTSTNTPDALTLKVRHDDGFIAWLNGVEIARRNAPASPQWDSAATEDRALTNAVVQETIDVSAGIGALVDGANVLAFQLLNSSSADPNALIQPELTATRLVITSNVFFDTPTPGAANTTPWYYDEVADTRFTVDRGFFTNAFSLSITSATPGAVIYYSFNSDEPGPTKGFLYAGPITISNTTVLRTRAFRDGWKPTDVDTATYLFLADVIHQGSNWVNTSSTPPQYFPATWGANAVNYGMDPEVVTNYTLAQWHEALTQIPTISIVTEMGNLFNPSTGIYANALQQGELWERPASIELIDPGKTVPGQFQENCGLRIRGGFSRNTQFPRHAFRIFFRREYGAARLNYPMFEDEGANEFDKFDLRNSSNYAWWRENPQGTNDTWVREVWCRETLGAMGQPYRRSRYYHLYLNGHYWGISETDERPEAAYGETYFGGSQTNYDVVKCGNRGTDPDFITEATDGNLVAWSNLWTRCLSMLTNSSNSNYFNILGCNPDGSRNPALPVLIDVDNLIDYMLGIFYSGDGDAPLSDFLHNPDRPNNWFGMRDRTNPEVGFRFFNSDCEHTLGAPSSRADRTGPFWNATDTSVNNFAFSNPQYLHEELMFNAEYRMRFADRVQKHFFNGGALTLEACTNRWWRKANQITKAIRAYSARWGDVVRANPYGEADWTNTLRWVANAWFPPRAGIVLAQLTNDLLFPTIAAPTFNQYGGFVSSGFSLGMAQGNPGGTIYYTLDGTDPRLVGGDTSGLAQTYSGPIGLDGNVSVRARVKVGTNWSAVVETVFTTAKYFRDIAITEIMYNPVGVPGVDGDEFEFLEVKNTGTNHLNLSALSFTGGITFNFTNGTRLAPGAFFVLARNRAQFEARYPGVPVNGVYNGRLNNAGESVTLRHLFGGALFSVNYDDAAEWPQAADGFGFSVVPMSTTTNLNSDKPYHWRASSAVGGSPGADDAAPVIPAVVVNEVLTHTSNSVDFIELFNPTAGAANIGGWFLTDDPSVPKKYRVADGTTIPGGQFITFTEAQFNPTPAIGASFTLGAEGESVFLFSADVMTNLTGYSHGFSFGAAAEGVTFGRYVISTGEEQFPAQVSSTSAGANAGPLVGDVVISEIHYNPRPGGDAFIELKNRSTSAAPLYDPVRPLNTWRLNGIGFVFPTNVSVPPGGHVLVVETQPADFRARHNVPAEIAIFGPYGGTLQDNGELIELQRLDFRGTNNVAWVTVDAVRYNDRAPWPTAADGAGASLQRITAANYGNDPANWTAAIPTPGGASAGGEAPAVTTQPASQFVILGQPVTFTVGASGTTPFWRQWRFNGGNILDATNSSYSIGSAQTANVGDYSVILFNSAGSAESSNAVLTVGIPPSITTQPTNVFFNLPPDPRASTNPSTRVAVFRVAASSGNPPVTFQWRRYGTNLPAGADPNITGADTDTLTVSNVTAESIGFYSCLVSDNVTAVPTVDAALGIKPYLLVPPSGQIIAAGAPIHVNAVIMGWPPPYLFKWQRANSYTNAAILSSSTTNFVSFDSVASGYTNTASSTTNRYNLRLLVTNLATSAAGEVMTNLPIVTPTALLVTVLADTDLDGIPDGVETALGLAPNNPDDASGDLDGDGMSNVAEFRAGTDPASAASVLRISQTVVPGAVELSFGAISNRNYTIEYTDSLPDPSWSRLVDFLSALTNRVETFVDPHWTSNRFYRAVTPRQAP